MAGNKKLKISYTMKHMMMEILTFSQRDKVRGVNLSLFLNDWSSFFFSNRVLELDIGVIEQTHKWRCVMFKCSMVTLFLFYFFAQQITFHHCMKFQRKFNCRFYRAIPL